MSDFEQGRDGGEGEAAAGAPAPPTGEPTATTGEATGPTRESTAPAGQSIAPTGLAETPVATAMRELETLDGRDLGEHPDVYQRIHAELQSALTTIDNA